MWWRPQGDLNPCTQNENLVSWTGLDDGDNLWLGDKDLNLD